VLFRQFLKSYASEKFNAPHASAKMTPRIFTPRGLGQPCLFHPPPPASSSPLPHKFTTGSQSSQSSALSLVVNGC
jgi:hypothetical protein